MCADEGTKQRKGEDVERKSEKKGGIKKIQMIKNSKGIYEK